VNPGSQNARIGSFHPITEGDWTEGAYVSPVVEKMCIAVSQNDLATIRSCLEEGSVEILILSDVLIYFFLSFHFVLFSSFVYF
jgi:hypothetical protein